MIHRLVAVLISGMVAFCAWKTVRSFSRRNVISKLAVAWLGLILIQVGLGAWTVLSNKAADIATAHVVVGVLSLATGSMLCIFTFRSPDSRSRASAFSGDAAAQTALNRG